MVSTSVWKDDNRTYSMDIPNGDKVNSLVINADFPDFNEIDNYFPSLADRYKKFDLSDDIMGEYTVKQYPVSIIITQESGIYKVEVTNSGIGAFLLPVDKNNFMSTDGTMTLKFNEVEGKVASVELGISTYGITITGTK